MSELNPAELLYRLESMLKDGNLVEFWFDEDTELFWADGESDSTLRGALEKLVGDG